MKHGRDLLDAWRVRSKLNQKALAAALGVSNGYLSQILDGLRFPGRELSVQIETITGVPVSSWVDTRRGKSGKRLRSLAKTTNVYKLQTGRANG
jgi:transcriptional regulator with XRE-family HTH domain